MPPSASLLVRFDPSAAPSEPAEPEMSITLTTELLGRRESVSSRPGLRAQLIVDFSPQDPCSRLVLLGISITGHPDFAVDEARYHASTCSYAGPDATPERPWIVYSDAGEEDKDPILAISFPQDDLFEYFGFPVPNGFTSEYVPPLTPEEEAEAPEQALLVGSVDVQLPMRLYLAEEGSPSARCVRELIYDDAPQLTGSTVIGGPDPVFAIANSEIIEQYGDIGALEEGDYELYWRVYKGGGDIRYDLECDPSVLVGDEVIADSYTDARGPDAGAFGGGFGTFETQDLLVAKVRVEKKPLPFWAHTDAHPVADFNFGHETQTGNFVVRSTDRLVSKPRMWLGEGLEGEAVALSWEALDGWIYMGGRKFWQLPEWPRRLLAAGLRTVPVDDEDPEAGEVLALVVLAMNSGLSGYWLYTVKLRADLLEPVARVTIARPAIAGAAHTTLRYPADNSHQFSPDGSQLLCYRPLFRDSDGSGDAGAVWVCDFGSGATSYTAQPVPGPGSYSSSSEEEPGPWSAWTWVGDPDEDPCAFRWRERTTGGNASGSGTVEGVHSAYWDQAGNVRKRTISVTANYSSEQTSYTKHYSYEGIYSYDEDASSTSSQVDIEVKEEGAVIYSKATADGFNEARSRWEQVWIAGYGCEAPSPPFTTEEAALEMDRCGYYRLPCTRGGEASGSGTLRTLYIPALHARPDLFVVMEMDERQYSSEESAGQARVYVNGALRLELEHGGYDHPPPHILSSLGQVYSVLDSLMYPNRTDMQWAVEELLGDVMARVGVYLENWVCRASVYDDSDGSDTRVTELEDLSVEPGDTGVMTPNVCLVAIDPGLLGAADAAAERPSPAALIQAHNGHRAGLALDALTQNAALSQAAGRHCAWMADTGTVSHTGEGGSSVLDRAQQAGYSGGVGENLAAGQESVAAVMAGWLGSAGHKANIEDPAFVDIGVAIAERDAGGYYWCVVFGAG